MFIITQSETSQVSEISKINIAYIYEYIFLPLNNSISNSVSKLTRYFHSKLCSIIVKISKPHQFHVQRRDMRRGLNIVLMYISNVASQTMNT